MTEQTDATEKKQDVKAPLAVRVTQLTDVGRVRTENQDSSILSTPNDEVDRNKGRLMVVADGMGGHRGGATASRMAATIVKEEFYRDASTDITASLRHALERANEKIYFESQSNPDLRGMGTTCSALVVRGDKAFFAHVGDSRIYVVRGGTIRQLTDDHSLVASMVREGLLTTQEAETHPRRNVLQRSMGVSQIVEIDAVGGIEVIPGDTFILCSDGLHGLVKSDEMLDVAKAPIDDACREFVRRAMERGAPDNVTVVMGRVEETTPEELEAEAAVAREARRKQFDAAVSRPTEEIPFEEMSNLAEMPTVKISVISEDSDEETLPSTRAIRVPVAEDHPGSPQASSEPGKLDRDEARPAASPGRTRDVKPREVKSEGGSLGWVFVVLVVIAILATSAYLWYSTPN